MKQTPCIIDLTTDKTIGEILAEQNPELAVEYDRLASDPTVGLPISAQLAESAKVAVQQFEAEAAELAGQMASYRAVVEEHCRGCE
jgi:hypothetical protein